jgi:uncharacterized membrane protein YqiK
MAEAERRKALALLAAQERAEAAAALAAIAAASDKATASDKLAAKREEAEALKAVGMAEVEIERASIEARNACSDAQVAMELELARLEAMPKIVAEMVKPAEKIKGININHITGLGGGSGSGEGSAKTPINQALDSIMDMAVQLPALQKIGDQIGLSLEDGLDEIRGQSGRNPKD